MLTYAYNRQPHTSTRVPPFEWVLSRTPGPIALKTVPSREEPKGQFKQKWKHRIQDTMKKTKGRLHKEQACYKNNYDSRLRRQPEVIQEGDYMYLRVKCKPPEYDRHNLAPISKCPFKVTKVDRNTITIEKTDRSFETVSRSRLVLAPTTKTEKKVRKILQPVNSRTKKPT